MARNFNLHATGRRLAGRARAQRGMTLVELMVALLLGLVTTYFISQVFAIAEGQKRTATFGTDAQVNGAVALHTLRQHVMGSGYGLIAAQSALGCPLYGEFGTAGNTKATPAMSLVPVVITPGGSASAPSDEVQVITSTKSSFAAPVMVDGRTSTQEKGFKVSGQGGSLGFELGDTFAAIPADWKNNNNECLLFTVSEDKASPNTTLDRLHVPFVSNAASSFNAAGDGHWPVASGQKRMPDKTLLVNFGAMRQMTFKVVDDTFRVDTWTPQSIGNIEQLNSGIVLLKALYGRDTSVPADGTIDVYDTTTPTTTDGWKSVLSVRLVIVARSGQRERTKVTTAAPKWSVGGGTAVTYSAYPGSTTTCAANAASCELPLPISQLADWEYYRYKVFDTAVPVRNLMWNAEEE